MEIIKGVDLAEDITTAFDHIFWCGDLNYRIDLPREDVISACKGDKPDFAHLLENDQLLKELAKPSPPLFYEFTEGKINFKPTYKFDPGKPHDVYSDEKARIPSWCDRILWSSQQKGFVVQEGYNATYTILTSDHVPVWATFKVKIPHPVIPIVPCYYALALYDIKMRGLNAADLNGKSDPYIKFSGTWTVDKPRTKIKSTTLDPDYGDEIIVLQPLSGDLEWLRTQILKLTIWDYDHEATDDLLGRTFIDLSHVGSKKEVVVDQVIRCRGVQAGSLQMKMILVETPKDKAEKLKSSTFRKVHAVEKEKSKKKREKDSKHAPADDSTKTGSS